jgi:actin-related protein 6
MPVVVVDNGGGILRGGFAGQETPRRIVANALARGKRDKKLYIGDKILNTPIAEYILSRPSQRGLVTDWEVQKLIWEHGLFSRDKLSGSFSVLPEASSSTAVFTMSSFTPNNLKKELLEILFNDFGFNRAVVLDGTLCAQYSPGITAQFTEDDWANPCGIIVDCGFSHCTVIPVFETLPVPHTAQRVPVAGRVLNNLLRERLAYLQVDLDDNPLLVQALKEDALEVATNGLKHAMESVEVETYMLPDFSEPPYVARKLDHAPTTSQLIKIKNDKFSIPEAVFNPRSVGVDSLGITDAIVRAIELCPESIRRPLAKKIIVCGGTVMMRGFIDRVKSELESALPFPIRIITETRPDLSVWRGAAQLATNEDDLTYLGAIYRDDWRVMD